MCPAPLNLKSGILARGRGLRTEKFSCIKPYQWSSMRFYPPPLLKTMENQGGGGKSVTPPSQISDHGKTRGVKAHGTPLIGDDQVTTDKLAHSLAIQTLDRSES